MATEGLSEAAWASCRVITFSPHIGISIVLMFAALVILLFFTLLGIRRETDHS